MAETQNETNNQGGTQQVNTERLIQHRESTLDALQDLMDRNDDYQEHYRTFQRNQAKCMTDPTDLAERSKRLQTKLLPQLRCNLKEFLSSLDSLTLLHQKKRHHDDDQDNTTHHEELFKKIIEKIKKIEISMHQIQLCFFLTYPTPTIKTEGPFGKLTLFKYLRLITKIVDLKNFICSNLLNNSFVLILNIDFNSDINLLEEKQQQPEDQHGSSNSNQEEDKKSNVVALSSSKANIIEDPQVYLDVMESIRLIDEINEWFNLPEFASVHELWRQIATSVPIPIYDMIISNEMMMLATQRLNEIANLAPVIFKLIRLLFNKISNIVTKKGKYLLNHKNNNDNESEENKERVQELLSSTLDIISEVDILIDLFETIEEDNQTNDLLLPLERIENHLKNLIDILLKSLQQQQQQEEEEENISSLIINHVPIWLLVWHKQVYIALSHFRSACIVPSTNNNL